MAVQPEQVLEDNLVTQLVKLGYDVAQITDEKSLLANLKQQLEKLNSLKVKLSDNEFKQVLNMLSKGSVFKKPKPYVIDYKLIVTMVQPYTFNFWLMIGIKTSFK